MTARILGTFLLVSLFGSAPAAATWTADIYRKNVSAVVRITATVATPNGLDASEIGNGVVISRFGHVLSCNHVVPSDAQRITAQFQDNTTVTLSVVQRDEIRDLILLRFDTSEMRRPVVLGNSARATPGMQLALLGFPANQPGVQIVDGLLRSSDTWTTTLPLTFGDSGSPVFGTDGTVIGIAAAGYPGLERATKIIPINDAAQFCIRIRLCRSVSTFPGANDNDLAFSSDFLLSAPLMTYSDGIANLNAFGVAYSFTIARTNSAGIQVGYSLPAFLGTTFDDQPDATELVDEGIVYAGRFSRASLSERVSVAWLAGGGLLFTRVDGVRANDVFVQKNAAGVIGGEARVRLWKGMYFSSRITAAFTKRDRYKEMMFFGGFGLGYESLAVR